MSTKTDAEAMEDLKRVVLDLYHKDPAKAIKTLSASPPEIMGAAGLILAVAADEMGHAGRILANLAVTPQDGTSHLKVVSS